jgi:hypothetical protein
MTGNEYPGVEGVVCNNLAWADLHLDDHALVPEAVAMSARAHELMPWERYVISTRGCVEALHGDAELAVELLTSERVRTSEKVRASTFSALAAAYARLGRTGDSDRALALAEKSDLACPLLAIVRRRLPALQH